MSENLRRATLDEAKAAWEAAPEDGRSIRKVIEAMRQNGLECSVSTFQKWKAADWMIKTGDKRSRTAQAKKLNEGVSNGIGEQEKKVRTRLETIEAEEADMKAERDRLLESTVLDSELARTAMRESLIAQIVLARQITRRAAVLVEVAPDVAAKLLDVLKSPLGSTTVIVPPAEQPKEPEPNGDDARVVQGRVIEQKSPTTLAIEQFKARQRHGVAA